MRRNIAAVGVVPLLLSGCLDYTPACDAVATWVEVGSQRTVQLNCKYLSDKTNAEHAQFWALDHVLRIDVSMVEGIDVSLSSPTVDAGALIVEVGQDVSPGIYEFDYVVWTRVEQPSDSAKLTIHVEPRTSSDVTAAFRGITSGVSIAVDGALESCNGTCMFPAQPGSRIDLDYFGVPGARCEWTCSHGSYEAEGCTTSFVVPGSDFSCDFILTSNANLLTETAEGGTIAVEQAGSVRNCDEICMFAAGETVEIVATPADGWSFRSWTGDCSGGIDRRLEMDLPAGRTTCSAIFEPEPRLVVSFDAQSALGFVVQAVQPSLRCPSPETCETLVPEGMPPVALTVSPMGGDTSRDFNVEWSGDCQGTSPSIQVMVDSDKTCTVRVTEALDCGTGQPPVAAVRVSRVPAGQGQGIEIPPTTVSNALKFSGFSNTDELLLESMSTADSGRVISSVEWNLDGATFRGPVIEWVHGILPLGTANGTITVTDSCGDSESLNLVFEAGAH